MHCRLAIWSTGGQIKFTFQSTCMPLWWSQRLIMSFMYPSLNKVFRVVDFQILWRYRSLSEDCKMNWLKHSIVDIVATKWESILSKPILEYYWLKVINNCYYLSLFIFFVGKEHFKVFVSCPKRWKQTSDHFFKFRWFYFIQVSLLIIMVLFFE